MGYETSELALDRASAIWRGKRLGRPSPSTSATVTLA